LVLLLGLREVRPHRVSRARHRPVLETYEKRPKIAQKARASDDRHSFLVRRGVERSVLFVVLNGFFQKE
jgi:hypothetical protein